MSTPYHSSYYAYELTRQCSAHDLQKLNQSIFNATVDLNTLDAQDEVDARKDGLIGEIETRLKQRVEEKGLFTIKWVIA